MIYRRETPKGYPASFFSTVLSTALTEKPAEEQWKKDADFADFAGRTKECTAAYDVVDVIKDLSSEEQNKLLAHVSHIFIPEMANEYRAKTIQAIRSIIPANRDQFIATVTSIFPGYAPNIAGHDRMWLTQMFAESGYTNAELAKFCKKISPLFSPSMNGNDRGWLIYAFLNKSAELDNALNQYFTLCKSGQDTDDYVQGLIQSSKDSRFGTRQKPEGKASKSTQPLPSSSEDTQPPLINPLASVKLEREGTQPSSASFFPIVKPEGEDTQLPLIATPTPFASIKLG